MKKALRYRRLGIGKQGLANYRRAIGAVVFVLVFCGITVHGRASAGEPDTPPDVPPSGVEIGPGSIGADIVIANDRLSIGTFSPCPNIFWLRQAVENRGGAITLEDESACSFLVQAPPEVIKDIRLGLQNERRVRYMELDSKVEGEFSPNDPYYNDPTYVYGPQQINAEDAWDYTLGDPDVIVAVLDTGLYPGHQEFSGRILPGYDFVNNDSDPTDDNGHGTHVTGIVAASTNNGVGIAGIAGNVKILPVKVLNAGNTGWWSGVASGITWAADHGAQIINLSLSGSVDSSALHDAVNYAIGKGVFVVASAGNSGTDIPYYPASYENILSLGATSFNGARMSLSNFGVNVDAMAPGGSVYSTQMGGGYVFMSGTSMAAPHGAGVAALMLSRNPNLTPAELKQMILDTAVDMGAPGVDNFTGAGRIDAGAAVASVPGGAADPPTTGKTATLQNDLSHNGIVDPGDTVRYTITVHNANTNALPNVIINDTVPAHTSYVTASTRLNTIPVLDDAAPASAFPLDAGGLNIGFIAANATSTVTFDAIVGSPSPVFDEIYNQAMIAWDTGSQMAEVVTPVGGTACTVGYVDATGNAMLAYQEDAFVYVSLTDADENLNPNSAQSVALTLTNMSNGDTETVTLVETGNNTGIFRGSLPSSVGASAQQSGNGILFARNGQTLQAGYTDNDYSPDQCSDTAIVTPPQVAAPLYLSDPGLSLDRIDPVAAGDVSTATSAELGGATSTLTFTQAPALTSALALHIGARVVVKTYINVTSGLMPANPTLTARLKHNGTVFATLNNPTYASGVLTWTDLLLSDLTIPPGEAIALEISTSQPGVTFRIRYDSVSAPSRVELPTSSFISISNFTIYDDAHPNGAPVSSLLSRRTAFVRATASSPFGAYDVARLDLKIIEPAACGGQIEVSLSNGAVIASTPGGKTYEYAWDTSGCNGGQHNLTATAYQGTEGVSVSAARTFEITPAASIADIIWADYDANGVQDNGEPGIANIGVILTGSDGVVRTTATNSDGAYLFEMLAAGTYTVTLDENNFSSDYNMLTTHYPHVVILGVGEHHSAADTGLTALATIIGDAIWYDADADGRQDAGEPGIGNVTLALYRDNGDGVFNPAADEWVAHTITRADGTYRLDAGIAGNYFVDVTDTGGVLTGLTHTLGLHSMAEPSPAITLGTGQVSRHVDFGYVLSPRAGKAVIGDLVWLDGNGNHIRDEGEASLAGVEVCASPTSGGASLCRETDLNGRFLIEAPAGSYIVGPVSAPFGLSIDSALAMRTLAVAAGEQHLAADFGYVAGAQPLASLGGVIWRDEEFDGVYNPASDSLIQLVSINLVHDADGNGVWDVDEPIVASVTSADGSYVFPHVLAGDYIVATSDNLLTLRRFAPIGNAANVAAMNADQASYANVHLAAGAYDPDVDFGYRQYLTVGNSIPLPGLIGNLVWEDVDGNGVYNAAFDMPLPGITVELSQGGSVIATTMTGLDGRYLFTDLAAPGAYSVRVIDTLGVLTAYFPATLGSPGLDGNNQPQPYTVSLSALAPENLTADFAYSRPASIGGMAFFDFNGDGLLGAGENVGVGNVPVTLRAMSTGATQTQSTVNGVYSFAGLAPDEYEISVPESVPGLTVTTSSPISLHAAGGHAYTNVNFGYIGPTAISLASFTVEMVTQGALLRWDTASEDADDGFAVWRAMNDAGPYEPASDVIWATGSPTGASYEWLDAASAQSVFWYQLRTLDGEIYGPIAVVAPAPIGFRTFAPRVMR